VYASVGGIKAVIWTDVLQAVMLFGGVGVIIAYTMWSEGTGPAAWWRTISADAGSPQLLWVGNFDVAERTTVLWALCSIVAWHSCTHCCDQVALQRYFTTTSATAARRSFVVSLVSSMVIGALLAVSGLALRYYYMRHPGSLEAGMTSASGAEKLMPRFFADVLPAGFGGLILVSFLCDALQTLGSGVNSIAAIISRDTAQHGGGAEAGRIRFARLSTLFVGGMTTILAVVAAYLASHSGSTIIDMLPKMFNMFLGPLAVLFMIGMFYSRATPGLAIIVVLLTQLVSTTWSWWTEIAGLLARLGLQSAADAWISVFGKMVDAQGHEVLRKPSVMLAIFAPVVFGLVLGAVVSALFGRRDHPGVAYTWKSVLSRPSERPDTT
jgi:SSS family solute:Na+ symporter